MSVESPSILSHDEEAKNNRKKSNIWTQIKLVWGYAEYDVLFYQSTKSGITCKSFSGFREKKLNVLRTDGRKNHCVTTVALVCNKTKHTCSKNLLVDIERLQDVMLQDVILQGVMLQDVMLQDVM